MRNIHIKYLQSFGSERIKQFAKYISSFKGLGVIERGYLSILSKHYKGGEVFDVICDIFDENHLWYTIYV
jgi:hypothetical protein